MKEISIIIIGRNEAARIEACLRSVFASLDGCGDCEILYVDSASDDNTVEIAGQFPIRILQLRPTWRLSAAAGRFVGYHHSSGKYLLFVDGDTDLDLYVYDENGILIASDTDSTETCVVRFWPKWTGAFRIEVRNLGTVYNRYEIVAY